MEKILKHVIAILHDIYVLYFKWETKNTVKDPLKISSGSEKDLFLFLREFEICPSIINKSKIYALWTQTTERSI